MRFVVGTDFSAASKNAAELAATLSSRLGRELVLVHAHEGEEQRARALLVAEEARLRAAGASIEARLAEGPPYRALLGALAGADDVLVIGLSRRREPDRLRLGSTTEQVAHYSPAPVLALRFDPALAEWLVGQSPLRVVLGDDDTPATDDVLGALRGLAEVGACDVTAAHVLPLPRRRDPSRAPAPPEGLAERLESRARAKLAGCRVEVGAAIRFGDVPTELRALAGERACGLVATGTGQRRALERVWSRSVARAVLLGSPVSVLVVPARTSRSRRRPPKREVAQPAEAAPL